MFSCDFVVCVYMCQGLFVCCYDPLPLCAYNLPLNLLALCANVSHLCVSMCDIIVCLGSLSMTETLWGCTFYLFLVPSLCESSCVCRFMTLYVPGLPCEQLGPSGALCE